MDELRKTLVKLIEQYIPDQVKVGIVKTLNEAKQSCSVQLLDDDIELFDVRLGAGGEGSNEFILFPEVNSPVLVGSINNKANAHYLVKVTKIKTIWIGGKDFGGLIKNKELNDNLTSIKEYLSDLKSAIATGINSVGIGASANGTTGKAAFESAMAGKTIKLIEMQNTRVKHG
ncbi:MAG: hypothetical protein NTZ33_12965 [Bacteroidetes bacterium]|nr:hypothetical protein [Bacteroidota bacterium]